MRIVLDTAILVRAHDNSQGVARDLLIQIIESDHILLISNAMLFELAKVLRYPRMVEPHGLSETRIDHYVGFLREASEIVVPNPFLITQIRDVNDTVVMQSASIRPVCRSWVMNSKCIVRAELTDTVHSRPRPFTTTQN